MCGLEHSTTIMEVKVDCRQTDRQSHKFFDIIVPRISIHLFLSVKFATSLLASLAGGLKNGSNKFCEENVGG